jgi:hypothetical protein
LAKSAESSHRLPRQHWPAAHLLQQQLLRPPPLFIARLHYTLLSSFGSTVVGCCRAHDPFATQDMPAVTGAATGSAIQVPTMASGYTEVGSGVSTEAVGGSAAGGQSCMAELYAIAQATGLLDLAAGALGRAIGVSAVQVRAVADATVTATHTDGTTRGGGDDKDSTTTRALSAAVMAVGKRHDQLAATVEALRTQLAEQQRLTAAFAVTMTRLDTPAYARDKFLLAVAQIEPTHAVCICARTSIPCCCRPCFVCV